MAGIDPIDGLVSEAFLTGPLARIILEPPARTRLEPQSVSGDPRHGAEAVVADPLWMIGRQWQLGELLGEDAGSPVAVHVRHRAVPVTAWAPVGDGAGEPEWRPWPEGALLDELVEHVPDDAVDRGLRWRAETGAQLVEVLREAGEDAVADALLAAHPLSLGHDEHDPTGTLDPAAGRLLVALAGVVPDGAAARDALAAGGAAWLAAAADPVAAAAAVEEWRRWFDGADGAGGAWSTPRLEHRFLLRFGIGADAVVLEATAFGAGSARWHHLVWRRGEQPEVPGDDDRRTDGPPIDDVLLATPLRYPGMPADRYWQLEDGSVDIAAIQAQPHDLARLCLAEFALVTGDDWLVVPVDGTAGALNQVLSVHVTTTFGESVPVPDDGEARRTGGFRMFEVGATGGDAMAQVLAGGTLDGLVFPPVATSPLVGDPVEEVAFVRDEQANLAWAVEKVVPGRSGDGRQRSAEPPVRRSPPPPDMVPGDLRYELQVPVPRHWIPLVPVRTAPGVVALRKGAMLDDEGEPFLAAGRLLADTPLTFPMEEIPREGITVRAHPMIARRRDGTYARWTGHRIRTGRGEAASGHASDETTR